MSNFRPKLIGSIQTSTFNNTGSGNNNVNEKPSIDSILISVHEKEKTEHSLHNLVCYNILYKISLFIHNNIYLHIFIYV